MLASALGIARRVHVSLLYDLRPLVTATTIALLALIGLGDDERFAGFQARSQNREALEAYVAAWVAERPSEEVLREFRRVDAAITKVLDMKDIFADEHFRARGMIAEVDGVVMQDVVARMSLTRQADCR
mgnify:CR=1 FL=1